MLQWREETRCDGRRNAPVVPLGDGCGPDPHITRPFNNHGKRAAARVLWLETEGLRREVRARYGGASSSAAHPAAPQPGPAPLRLRPAWEMSRSSPCIYVFLTA